MFILTAEDFARYAGKSRDVTEDMATWLA